MFDVEIRSLNLKLKLKYEAGSSKLIFEDACEVEVYLEFDAWRDEVLCKSLILMFEFKVQIDFRKECLKLKRAA